MKKTLIVLFAIVALIGSAAFETVTGQDTAAYLVMIANQGTQITNQLTALTRMTAHIDQLTGQFEHLKESALGQIGAITDPIADLRCRAHRPAQHHARLALGFHRPGREPRDGTHRTE